MSGVTAYTYSEVSGLRDSSLRLVRLSGKYGQKDPDLVGIIVDGEPLLAQPAYGGVCFRPTPEWLEANSDNYLAAVFQERGESNQYVIVGYVRKRGKAYQDLLFMLLSKEVELIFDDTEGILLRHANAKIEALSDDLKLTANTITLDANQRINLGGSASSALVKGDEYAQMFSEFITDLCSIIVVTPTGTGTLDPSTIARLQAYSTKIRTTLSTKVKTE